MLHKKIIRKSFFLLVNFLFPVFLFAQTISDISDTTIQASFRGLSVVNDNVLWLSGTKGTVGVSENGGMNWKWNHVKDFEKSDFRSLYAFNKKKAIIASAGTPAVILETEDGGATWAQRYRSDDSAMFFDGVAFWDENHGIIFGDPVNGKMFLMETVDGGKTWKQMNENERPVLQNGEAAFAASGTTIRVGYAGEVWIATGGVKSRLWHSNDYGHHWVDINTPILQGAASTGIFSFIIVKKNLLMIIGGDYANDTLSMKNFFYSEDGGDHWHPKLNNPHGYRSCIEQVDKETFIATGTSGTDILIGPTWSSLSTTGYNCVIKARTGKAVYFCGANGKIGKLVR